MSEPPLLDESVLDDMTAHIGAAAVRSVLALFVEETRGFVRTIGAVSGQPEARDAARRAAHSLKSSAGQMGAAALSEAARLVEAAAQQDAGDLAGLAAALARCADDTAAAIEARLGG